MSDASTVIMFEGGLDMVTPVQGSSAGTLVDCLNYEVGPIKGYKRIDGFERFDNFPGGGVSNLYRISLVVEEGGSLVPGTYLYSQRGSLLGIVAEVLDQDSGQCLYVPARPGASLMPGIPYQAAAPGAGLYPAHTTSPAEDWREVAPSAEEYVEQIIDAAAELRSFVRTAPRPVAGVHYGRHDAFAAVDCLELDVSSANPAVELGMFISVDGFYYRVQCLNNGVAQLHPMGYRASSSPQGYFSLTWRDVVDRAEGSPITGVVEPSSTEYDGSYSAGIYRLVSADRAGHASRGYSPIPASLSVRYVLGEQSFPSHVRLSNGSEWAEASVVGYSVDSGSFDNGDAVGILHLSPAQLGASDGWNGVIDTSFVLETAGGGSPLAEISAVFVPDLAGTGRLREGQHTHYQWGTFNFLATAGLEMTYCTTGKSRAAYVRIADDDAWWGNVVTQTDSSLDQPKYVSFHAGQRLVLGFEKGSVQLSAVGSPLNFSGLDGAVEIGNGDNITGLLEAYGDSTIVFGPSSIRRVVGGGADVELRTISPDAGAYDYTAAAVAGVYLYVNQNGVCTLDQTSSYGDFANSSVSGAVDPWLTPRVIQDSSSFELGGTVCAFPVRDKNQYRLFLGDGNVLNMSVTTDGMQPTISRYSLSEGALRVPLAWSSSVDVNGSEYVLVVWDRSKAEEGVRGVVEDLPADNTIYRLDHGWGFDGATFPHFIETAYLFNEEPTFLSVTKAVLYGMGYGNSSLRLRASGVEDTFDQPFDMTVQDISMPRNPDILYKTQERVMGIVDHANWGRAIKLRLENITPPGETRTEPHHILQSVRLFVQTEGVNE